MATSHEHKSDAGNVGRFTAAGNGQNRAIGRERRSGQGSGRANRSNAQSGGRTAGVGSVFETTASQDGNRDGWPFGRGVGRAFAAARVCGAELARATAIPSPVRHQPTNGLHLRSCRCCRKPFDSTETIGFAPMLTFKGTSRIVPVCLRCLPKSWRRRCIERHCEHCGRRMLVFDQPEYKPRRFCLTVCHVAAYYRKHRNEITARERWKYATFGRASASRAQSSVSTQRGNW
jgi:hypothetical protein